MFVDNSCSALQVSLVVYGGISVSEFEMKDEILEIDNLSDT